MCEGRGSKGVGLGEGVVSEMVVADGVGVASVPALRGVGDGAALQPTRATNSSNPRITMMLVKVTRRTSVGLDMPFASDEWCAELRGGEWPHYTRTVVPVHLVEGAGAGRPGSPGL
jgi:hypothetical protein